MFIVVLLLTIVFYMATVSKSIEMFIEMQRIELFEGISWVIERI
jgi:hypothetical protein